jgi:hypothetical protein
VIKLQHIVAVAKTDFTLSWYQDRVTLNHLKGIKMKKFLRLQMVFISMLLLGLPLAHSADFNEDIFNEGLKNNYSWQTRVAMDQKTKTVIFFNDDNKSDTPYRELAIRYRRCDNNLELTGTNLLLQEGEVDKRSSDDFSVVINGKNIIYATQRRGTDFFYGSFGEYHKEQEEQYLNDEIYGGFLEGRLPGVSKSNLLADAFSEITLVGQETVNDFNCFIIESKTPYGRITAWVSSELDYNFLKLILHKENNDLFNDKGLKESTLSDWKVVIDQVKYEKIEDHYIAVQGRYTRKAMFKDGRLKTTEILTTRENININPEFDALKAFTPKIPDGTILLNRDFDDIPYEWIDGKFVPYIEDIALEHLENNIKNAGYLSNSLPDSNKPSAEIVAPPSANEPPPISIANKQPPSILNAANRGIAGYLILIVAVVLCGSILLVIRKKFYAK